LFTCVLFVGWLSSRQFRLGAGAFSGIQDSIDLGIAPTIVVKVSNSTALRDDVNVTTPSNDVRNTTQGDNNPPANEATTLSSKQDPPVTITANANVTTATTANNTPSNDDDDDDDDESSSSERMVIGSPASDFETDDDDDDVHMEEALVETKRHSSWMNQMNPWKGRLVWNGFQGVSLEEWIREVRPSRFSSEAGTDGSSSCSWLQVYDVHRVVNPPPALSHLLPPDMTDFIRAQPDLSRYERLLRELACAMKNASEPSSGAVQTSAGVVGQNLRLQTQDMTFQSISILKQRCIEAIMKLAKSDGCLAGKWMVFCDPAEADGMWEKIAVATAHGKLGRTSKVSTTKHLLRQDSRFVQGARRQAVICVYVDDSTDQREVKRVLDVLRKDLGITTPGLSRFKPDIYTYIGVYSGNPWGLSPALYTAKEVEAWQH